eukprot:2962646-Pyramimonas_sp.AAC.1
MGPLVRKAPILIESAPMPPPLAARPAIVKETKRMGPTYKRAPHTPAPRAPPTQAAQPPEAPKAPAKQPEAPSAPPPQRAIEAREQ